jgi:tetratricopeptide (TPR) repeat protein
MSQEPENTLPEADEPIPLEGRFGTSGTLMVLFHDHWFALIALCILLGGIALALILPRIWRQTPEGFSPVIKVSGLDLWQARSLRQAAVKHHKAGRFNEAIAAWNSAISNNPGDQEPIREALGAVLAEPNPPAEQLSFSVSRAFWLLQLSSTNAQDLELTLKVLSHFAMDDYVAAVAGPWRPRLTPASRALLLKAYYDQGRIRDFGTLWNSHAEEFAKDPVLELYHQAWLATSGPAGAALAAQQRLMAARNDPAQRALAARLQLGVSFSRQDIDLYADALKALADEHGDRLVHHVYHWLLLEATGHREQAQRLAKDYTRPPGTPNEVGMAVTAFTKLGLVENAVSYLEEHLPRFAFEPDLWVRQAKLLTETGRWLELRTLAIAMRNDPNLRSQLDAYSYFAETLAESKLERLEAANAASERIATYPIPTSTMAREMAGTLRSQGFPKVAVALYRPWRTELKDDAKFWFEYSVAALTASADEDILAATSRALELAPGDISCANNHAAALIAFRRQPEEAIKLTLRVMNARPGEMDAQLNHVLALLQNGRDADAERMLRQMNTLNFGINESSVYHLGWFELNLARKEWIQARAAYDHIDPRHLLGVQARWIDEQYRALPETK